MPRRALVSALVALALIGSGLGAYAIVTAQQHDPPPKGLEDRPTPVVHVVITVPFYVGPPSTPSNETSPTSCGAFLGVPDVAGTTAFEMTAEYGELRSCGLFGNTWVITTSGKFRQDGSQEGGVVGLYACESGDEVCLDNTSDHPLSGWTFVTPPYSGSVKIMRVLDDDTLLLGVGNERGGQAFDFDLATRQFSPLRPVTPAPGEG